MTSTITVGNLIITHGGTVVSSDVNVVPQRCTRRQGRLALLQTGYLDIVESNIAAIENPTSRREAQIEYEADAWERGNAFLQQMWTQQGGTSEQLDDLFKLAVTL